MTKTMMKTMMNGPTVSRLPPISIALILPIADNILDINSTNPEKAMRARQFHSNFQELAKTATIKKKNNDNEKTRTEYEFLNTLFAHINNLANSFNSLQVRWHNQVDNIVQFYSSKLNGNFLFENAKKLGPLFTTFGLGTASYYTGLAGGFVKVAADFATSLAGGLERATAEFIAKVLGFAIGTGVYLLLKKGNEKYKVRIRNKRDAELDVLLKEEVTVRKAIRDTVQQLYLGLAAEFGYISEIKKSDDIVMLKLAKKGNVAGIWKEVDARLKKILEHVPANVRDLFASSLSLPDYIATKINEAIQAAGKGKSQ